ncbi:NADPH:quinone reductase-like Zn-dependent oxidoreductase [Actinoplanes lutulentus]|uniref:NADPH:quinone reductase-like Zn-dependent oxidoreductase n=1 Tax=Actinoplanes lutulentus TaxID=1287878 RepID=A0A327YYR8_9ACTN|nr:NADP-dependent oxidoreductase [Actinoplanes lutulentus]MBB2943443.1 NADPH:quinone reductase-like Zn-dependent oxidoreductase [Actinoplanes lutulentus]RAK26038.1 NADPH:quinone reductase-like Zn-dependent oxidoreductase [Actinoplanes lutulentus]
MSDVRWIAESHGGIDSMRLVAARVPAPGAGEVTIAVRACGMNPIDYKNLAGLPGFEVAGVISAAGPGARHSVGEEVLAFRVEGGYASALTVADRDVFAKPAELSFPQAANLLLAGTAAAEMLHLARIAAGDTVLVHGAAGAVGVSVLQQLRELGATAIGTASAASFATVREFGGTPITYGPGLAERVRRLAGPGLTAALDCVGTREAVDVSLLLVPDRDRIVTTAAHDRAYAEGFHAVGGTRASVEFRDRVRPHLIDLARRGRLTVPIGRVFPLGEAVPALRLLASGHAGGKLALIPAGAA